MAFDKTDEDEIDMSEAPTRASADPRMVEKLVRSIAVGMQKAIVADVTTQADLLSAVFTVLYRMLNTAKTSEDEDWDQNCGEIGRVLQDMLLVFGEDRVVQ